MNLNRNYGRETNEARKI